MNTYMLGSASALVIGGLIVLAGCDPKPPAPSTSTSTSTSTTTSNPSTSSAAPSVNPHSGDLPASTASNGPADGATAIGGMSANQDAGGARKGGTPAPTGGDGAASSSAK